MFVELNNSIYTVIYAGIPFALTSKEYMLLEYFLLHPTQVIARSALFDRLWEFNKISGEQTIKTHLTNLRRKLKKAGSQKEIAETVYRVGYWLGNAW